MESGQDEWVDYRVTQGGLSVIAQSPPVTGVKISPDLLNPNLRERDSQKRAFATVSQRISQLKSCYFLDGSHTFGFAMVLNLTQLLIN